jgi:hypothetical protein
VAAPDEFDAALREALARWPDSGWPDEVDGRLEKLWRAMTDAEQDEARRRTAALNAARAKE